MKRVEIRIKVPKTLVDEFDKAVAAVYKTRTEAAREAMVEWMTKQDDLRRERDS